MNEYDCIVVGARCAGAALATHLARSGMRVLVLEADALHTDRGADGPAQGAFPRIVRSSGKRGRMQRSNTERNAGYERRVTEAQREREHVGE